MTEQNIKAQKLNILALLDNSVVVMENIYRLKGLGVENDEACVRGTVEVWKSIVAATVTTITVFLPFLFAEDYMIKLIGEHVGVSIVATLTISLVVALLLIPMAMNYLLKKQRGNVNFSNLSVHNRLIQMYIAILKMRKPTFDFLPRASCCRKMIVITI